MKSAEIMPVPSQPVVPGQSRAIDVKLANGKVSLTPDPNQKYKFTTSLMMGKLDTFTSSDAKDALKISLNVTNGVIEHD